MKTGGWCPQLWSDPKVLINRNNAANRYRDVFSSKGLLEAQGKDSDGSSPSMCLFLTCSTWTSRTSPPAGAAAWRFVPSSTSFSQMPLSTQLLTQQSAERTLPWPSPLLSEHFWYSQIPQLLGWAVCQYPPTLYRASEGHCWHFCCHKHGRRVLCLPMQ